MVNSKEIESGNWYGRIMLTGKSFRNEKHTLFVEGICRCGKTFFRDFQNLKNKSNKSCGCLAVKHGLCKKGVSNVIYKAWCNMKNRCYQRSHKSFKNYGGRGIKVCPEWIDDFVSFNSWAVSNKWEEGLTLEREKVNGDYSPANCSWKNVFVQSRNKRSNFNIEAFGEKKCLFDWSRDLRCKVSYVSIANRIKKFGWSAEKAISTPPANTNNKKCHDTI